MGMNIVRYKENGNVKWGLLVNGNVRPLDGAYDTLASFLENGVTDAKQQLSNHEINEIPFSKIELLSPVTTPTQIVCQGANYSAHREESGLTSQRPPFNLIFPKAASSITDAHSEILSPAHVKLLDYEIEIGLVIKKEISKQIEVLKDNLSDYIAGIVITNDISERDVQFTEGQWYKGKSYRTFCPVGPVLYLFESNEASYIHDLELTLSVNGEIRQSANTTQLLYKPEETLTELSGMMSFNPGDLILTGTPGGVALKLSEEDQESLMNSFSPLDEKIKRLNESQMNNENYLHHGDVIVSQVKSSDGKIDLGTQENKVVVYGDEKVIG